MILFQMSEDNDPIQTIIAPQSPMEESVSWECELDRDSDDYCEDAE